MAELSPGRSPISANLSGRQYKSEKTLFFCISNSPQKRHPERSAAQIYRVTQRLVARSRRTPTVLILLMPFGAFQPLKPAPGGPATVFLRADNRTASILLCPAATSTRWVPQQDPVLGLRWSKRSEQHEQDKHRRGPSTPRHQALCHAINLCGAPLRMTFLWEF
jgi:hypothetical protein